VSWIDSHCHLDFDEFPEPLELINRLINADCERLMVPAISARYFDRVLNFQKLKPNMIDVALGLHPYFLDQHKPDDLDTLTSYIVSNPPLAIGEIGLDLMLSQFSYELQLEYFERQLVIAKNCRLPVIIHCRKAHDELLKACRSNGYTHGGIIHAFSGSQQQAKKYLDAGFVLGLGGALTHDRAKAMHKLVAYLPDNGYVLETDSPDMAPAFAKGQINTPLNVPKIAYCIANLRHQTLDRVYIDSSASYRRVLGLKA
jgi:TatD DNase family protein